MSGPDVRPLGECFDCSAPAFTRYQFRDGDARELCPACSHRAALRDTAAEQLHRAAAPVLLAWLATWGSVPGTLTLPEALEQLGRELEQERKATGRGSTNAHIYRHLPT